MIPTALPYLPALLLPLAVQAARMPTVWLFMAAAAGFTVPPLAHLARARNLGSGTDSLFHETYYVVSRAPADATVALVFATLAVVQVLKARHYREEPRITAVLFWILLFGALGSRPVETVAIPAVAPTRNVDFPSALRPWDRANAALLAVSLAALVGLSVPMVLLPVIRRGSHRGGR